MEVLEKKRHHFVWRFYLESWATKGKIWCLSKQNSKIFSASTENIGVEKFFYQIKEFTDEDRIFLKSLLLDKSDSPELLCPIKISLPNRPITNNRFVMFSIPNSSPETY